MKIETLVNDFVNVPIVVKLTIESVDDLQRLNKERLDYESLKSNLIKQSIRLGHLAGNVFDSTSTVLELIYGEVVKEPPKSDDK